MRVEYLTIVDANSSFCRDKSSFNSFLQSNADIKIKSSQLRHKSLEVTYELQGGCTRVRKPLLSYEA
jgi:transcription termination factor Rho